MANNRIEMINLRHLIRLKIKKRSNRSIAEDLGIARNTVNEYVQFFDHMEESYEQLYQWSELDLYALFPKKSNKLEDKYEILSGNFKAYEQALQSKGGTYLNVWKEYRDAHGEGGYSYNQFKTHLKDWIKGGEVSMRVDHKFADKLFVDYSGKKLKVRDKSTGTDREVEVFVAILGASQYTYAQASETQQLDDFLNCRGNALEYLEGVPQAIVPDNLKSAVTKPDRYEAEVNRNYKAFGLHYNTTILPTRTYKPKDKALVEGAVKLVYQRIFFPLRNMVFFSLADLNRAIGEELEKHNKEFFTNRDYSRKDLFEQQEKPLLEALPQCRFERKIYREYKVNKDTHVWFGQDKHYYSVPFKYVGKHVQLQATKTTLEVYYNYQRIALHRRSDKIGGFTTKEEHLPANIRFVKDWSMDQFTEKASKIGQQTHAYFCKIFEQKTHPEQAYKSCMGILSLRKAYSSERINKACHRASYYGNYSYKTIRNILKKGFDQLPLDSIYSEAPPQLMDESDPNIRGANYFQ